MNFYLEAVNQSGQILYEQLFRYMHMYKRIQSWALPVFFNFFNNKKWFVYIFYQVNNLFKKATPSQINLIKNAKKLFIVIEKFKNTESAQLWLLLKVYMSHSAWEICVGSFVRRARPLRRTVPNCQIPARQDRRNMGQRLDRK